MTTLPCPTSLVLPVPATTRDGRITLVPALRGPVGEWCADTEINHEVYQIWGGEYELRFHSEYEAALFRMRWL